MNSSNPLRYLYNNTAPLFSKEFFQESSKGNIIGTSLFYLIIVAYVITYIVALIQGWDFASYSEIFPHSF